MQNTEEFDDVDRIGHSIEFNGRPDTTPRPVKILDTTLREGEQSPNVSLTMRQRLQIAWMLDYFGVDAIEISPIISEDYRESCKKLLNAGLSAKIVAHGRALKEDIDISMSCGADYVAMYHSVSDIHLKYKLKVNREEALRRATEAVQYAKSHGLYVRMTLEDACRADPEYMVQFAKEMEKAGADRLSIPDTVGIMRPIGMYRLVSLIRSNVKVPLDVHCHNDMGLALANALASYEAGADQIHATIGGVGERVGITDLAQLVISLLVLYRLKLNVRYDMLAELSGLLATYANYQTPSNSPLVGANAYKHKAGTHIAAILKSPNAYEIVPPSTVGNRRSLVFGELLGKNGSAFFLKLLGMKVDDTAIKSFSKGMKDLRRGDLFELELTKEMERAILSE
ncbi:MAG: 2-isopropylmalate synthase [Nitrososphaerota archaeon]|nr:2-isopropylmalate synthase [Nitrososphaerota archaeon]MDG7048767.1 2-isopropylmalate synthase [Nitrososphaerota archaeon]MDG7051361.1 2-isopropylmalate synthase [Nitrososphaerota archaeon]